MEMRCPICNRAVYEKSGDHWPFCTPRCQLIDLGRWAEEGYRIPGEKSLPEEEFPFEITARPDPLLDSVWDENRRR